MAGKHPPYPEFPAEIGRVDRYGLEGKDLRENSNIGGIAADKDIRSHNPRRTKSR